LTLDKKLNNCHFYQGTLTEGEGFLVKVACFEKLEIKFSVDKGVGLNW